MHLRYPEIIHVGFIRLRTFYLSHLYNFVKAVIDFIGKISIILLLFYKICHLK